jgi:hypothetical protein
MNYKIMERNKWEKMQLRGEKKTNRKIIILKI